MTLLLAALLAATPTATPAPAQAPAPAPVAEEPKAERKICRREALAVGLHRSKRICLTAAEWRQREGQGNVDGMNDAATRGR